MAIVVIAVIVATQVIGRAWSRIAGVTLAILVGCFVCAPLGGLPTHTEDEAA